MLLPVQRIVTQPLAALHSIYISSELRPILPAQHAQTAAQVAVGCTLWGSPISTNVTTNYGQFKNDFAVVITGSSGYVLNNIPAQVQNYTASVELFGAVSFDSIGFLSSRYSTLPYNNSLCAFLCTNYTQTQRSLAINRGNTTYQACNFFNTFNLTYQSQYQGQHCVLYKSSPLATFAARNAVTYSTSNATGTTYIYNITNSFGTTLSPADPGIVKTTWTYTPSGNAATCTAFNKTANSLLSQNKVQYNIACGYDLYNVAEIGSTPNVADFYTCTRLCDAFAGCTAFTYFGKTCFFKNLNGIGTNQLPQPVTNGVDFAWQPADWQSGKTVAYPWTTVSTAWPSTVTSITTSFISGTGFVIVQTPARTTSGVGSITTTYITIGIDSGTATTIATNTITPTNGGTVGTVQVIYPTPACTNKGFNVAFYDLLKVGNGPSGYPWDQYKTVQPTYTATASNYIAFQDANYMYGRPNTSLVVSTDAHFTFYLFAGRGSGNYTINMSLVDDYEAIWIGQTAISGWNNSNIAYLGAYYTTSTVAVTFYLHFGTYTPIRIGFVNGKSTAALALDMWAPDGTLISHTGYSSTNTSYFVDHGWISPNFISKPCNDGIVSPFPPWGIET